MFNDKNISIRYVLWVCMDIEIFFAVTRVESNTRLMIFCACQLRIVYIVFSSKNQVTNHQVSYEVICKLTESSQFKSC